MSKANPLVMIVDDDGDIREALAEAIEDLGYCTVSAANGRDAIDRLRSLTFLPCLILLDLMMPVMDGRQFREAQLHDERLEAIPVAIITAHAVPEEASRDLGVIAALGKPIDLPALQGMIRRHCDSIARV
jgi:CheY-like chemotaxis protein